MKIVLNKFDKRVSDITNSTSKISWSGKNASAPRTLQFNFIKKESEVNIELGDVIVFLNDNNKELFRGLVYKNKINMNGTRGIVCYDALFYWANNTDTFVFNKETLSNIVSHICKRFSIARNKIEASKYVIPTLSCDNEKLYDIFKKAANLEFKNTGKRYYLRAERGYVNMFQRNKDLHEWILETEGNIISWDMEEDATDLKTKVKLINKADKKTLTATAQDNNLIKKFGILQEFENVSDKTTQSKLNQRANTTLKEKNIIKKSFSIDAIGIDEVMAGSMVFVRIPALKIGKYYYVESDKHTYDNGVHKMSLDLVEGLGDIE